MYRCQLCNSIVQSGTSAHRVVIETRPAEYPSRAKSHHHRIGRKLKHSDDPGGAGYEIAKEVLACRSCAQERATKQAAEESAQL